ncbi:AAA family ATPase [Plebeiibacterium marinum]|uniref:ATP-binding protein n=1 Tax=Plebeiibacterium marinum TaxID=2992111 RepID=A0AAE3SJG8_9BACT|nr:AAA family ATPase [Plebeiobacterium marinum]MCW3805730.1 ATP-binding protein [Plebeiobacterium marinum]
MQRIKSITLRNFKFFYGTEAEYPKNKIDLEKDNLLLYGENGSGKSTIYWALYTFLQSCLKTGNHQIKKYFSDDETESLKNRYATNGSESGIIIDFISSDGTITQKVISNRPNGINTKGGTLVRKTLNASDFLNYKYLSKLYDFRNSEPINLFPLFVKDLLMFIDFEEEYPLLNGELSGKSYASDWWDYILTVHEDLPRNKSMKHTISESSEEYKMYKEVLLPKFVDLLKNYLLKITEATNNYLTKEFNESFKISFNTDKIVCDFNKPTGKRAKDGKLHKPKIFLTAELLDDKLDISKRDIPNPHTFLNEAKLTAIALSIRFAMLDERGTFADACSLLVLDDLLVSLDMSHRNIVLDIILRKANRHQLLIMTHDRFFFQMAQNKIKHYKQNNWKFIEMYSHKNNEIPLPLIYDSESYLGKAIRYLDLNEYEIAGNFLRKEAENFLKEILPNRYKLNDEGKLKALGNLLSEAVVFSESNGLDKSLFERLNSHREFVLNPSSHDSYDVPKFYSELSDCINTLTELRKIEITQNILKKGTKLEFEVKCVNHGDNYKYNLVIQDDSHLIKEPGKTEVLTKGNINFKIFKEGVELPPKDKNIGDWHNENNSIINKYNYCYNKSDKSGEESFWDGVSFTETSEKLITVKPFN